MEDAADEKGGQELYANDIFCGERTNSNEVQPELIVFSPRVV